MTYTHSMGLRLSRKALMLAAVATLPSVAYAQDKKAPAPGEDEITERAELDDQHVLCLGARVLRAGGVRPRADQVFEFPYSNKRL